MKECGDFPEEDTHYCATCEKIDCGGGIAHCSMSVPDKKGVSFRSRCRGMFVRFVPIGVYREDEYDE